MQQCLLWVGTLKDSRVFFLLYSLGISMILVLLRDGKMGRCGVLQLVTTMKIANGDFVRMKVEIFLLLFFLLVNVTAFLPQGISNKEYTTVLMDQNKGQKIKKHSSYETAHSYVSKLAK